MLTPEEFQDLGNRLEKGKEYISSQPNGWSGGTNPPFVYSSERNQIRYREHTFTWREHKAAHAREKSLCTCKEKMVCECGLSKLQRSICEWFKLSKEWLEEAQRNGTFGTSESEKHSQAWLLMKRNEALEKWKHTLKAKRGPDPRTLPLEAFA